MDIELKNHDLTVVVKSLGAQLTSVRKGSLEYLWSGDTKWWHGQAPILFPIAGSLRDNRAETSRGPAEMPRHGLTRKMEHSLISRTDTSVTFEIRADEETKKKFPFDYILRTSYTLLDEKTVETKLTAVNVGEGSMPFAVGGHPAFSVPVDPEADEKFTDYALHFTQKITRESPTVDAKGLSDLDHCVKLLDDADTLPMTHEMFDHDLLTLEDIPDHTVTLSGNKTGRGVKLTFPGFGFLGVWSAAGEAPFVAVEPWTGCSTCSDEDDVFEHKRGVQILEPGQESTHAFTIELL